MNYQILKTELALPAYAAMSDQEAADALNAETVSALQKVRYKDVISYLFFAEKIVGIKNSVLDSAVEVQYAPEIFDGFDLNDANSAASVNRLLDALITDNLITATDKAAILAMADTTTSRAQQLGLGHVKTGYVEHARTL